jgi:hypothetical protein
MSATEDPFVARENNALRRAEEREFLRKCREENVRYDAERIAAAQRARNDPARTGRPIVTVRLEVFRAPGHIHLSRPVEVIKSGRRPRPGDPMVLTPRGKVRPFREGDDPGRIVGVYPADPDPGTGA